MSLRQDAPPYSGLSGVYTACGVNETLALGGVRGAARGAGRGARERGRAIR